MSNTILQFFRSPLGRTATAMIGLAAVVFLLVHTGVQSVSLALLRTAPFFPAVLFLEGAILSCTVLALRTLYQKEGTQIPTAIWIRVGLIGYAVMGLVPAGRAVAEATRATLLSRFTSAPRASAEALRIQAIALIANSTISIPGTLALYLVAGPSLPTLSIALNALVTSIGGFGILFTARNALLGKGMGRLFPRMKNFGKEFDSHLLNHHSSVLAKALGLEFFGRTLQVLQNAVLVYAVGGKFGIGPALCSEAFHLVGAATGELIPAQLGTTELSYQFFASSLSLSPSDALAIPILAHTAQLIWIALSIFVGFKMKASL